MDISRDSGMNIALDGAIENKQEDRGEENRIYSTAQLYTMYLGDNGV